MGDTQLMGKQDCSLPPAAPEQGWTAPWRRAAVSAGGGMLTLLLAATGRGDSIFIYVHFFMQHKHLPLELHTNTTASNSNTAPTSRGWLGLLDNAHWYIIASLGVSMLSYVCFAGWLHWYFYIRRREQAREWKCQPDKFLTPDNERHEMMSGLANMALGGTVSGLIAAYIINGGYTTLYFRASERGWLYLAPSAAALFLLQDGLGYYAHRLYHIRALYRRIHRHHHRYHSPSPWAATAMHPLEFLTYQTVLVLPAFLLPVYSGVFIFVLLYGYYYGVIDHSGIYMEAIWPWQPSSMFHDNHHKYFHCNFGFNTKIWDWLHDTMRRQDRVYTEDTFGGQGRQMALHKHQ